LFYQSPLTPEIVAFFHEIFHGLSERDDPVTIANIAWFVANMGDYLSVSYEALLRQPVITWAADRSPEAKAIIEEALSWADHTPAEAFMNEDLQRYEEALAARNVFKAAEYARGIALSCRVTNDAGGCMEWWRRAVDHAAASGSMLSHADKLGSAFFHAWYWGDDDTAARYLRDLEEQVQSSGYHPVWVAFRRMYEVGDDLDTLPVPPLQKVYALLIAAGNASDQPKRVHLLSRAERLALHEEFFYGLVGPAIVAACPERTDMLSTTMDVARKWGANRLVEALEALQQGKPSHLTRFLKRFSDSVRAQPCEAEMRLEILSQRVLHNGKVIRISAQDTAMLAFLARSRAATSREEIQDAFWEDADANAARDALYSMLYRIRKRCGKTEIVENVGNAYRLGSAISVDIWDIETTVQHISRNVDVPISVVRGQYECLRARSYQKLIPLAWFGPLDFRIKEHLRRLAQYLISEAQSRRDYTTVLHVARAMIAEDNCDEWAHQTIIRTWHEMGNQIEAVRAYRDYCAVLRNEMNAEPSPELRADAERLRLIAS
jgi:DNA-binding SARP family transcriptional activator